MAGCYNDEILGLVGWLVGWLDSGCSVSWLVVWLDYCLVG